MRIHEIISEQGTLTTARQLAPELIAKQVEPNLEHHPLLQKLAQYGPAVVKATEELMAGEPSVALLTAITAVSPQLKIDPRVVKTLDTAAQMEILYRIARNPALLSVFLTVYSKPTGRGEEEQLAKIRAAHPQS